MPTRSRGKPMIIKDGRFGAYVTDGEVNATLRRGDEIESITPERGAELLAEKRAKGPAPKKRGGARRRPRRPPRRPGRGEEGNVLDRGEEDAGQEGRRPRRPPASTGADLRPSRSDTAYVCDATRGKVCPVSKGEAVAASKARHDARSPATRTGASSRRQSSRCRPRRQAARRRPRRRPPGQRLCDMPYSAAAPRMINPAIGLHNLVARAGHNAGYDIDLTLLDAPDHRLIRSGRAAGPPGAGRPRRVVSRRARLGAAAAQGADRADGAGRPARGAGRPDPAVPAPGAPSARWRRCAATARVRPARRSRRDHGAAPRRQGDRAPRRADHRPLPRGDDDPDRAGPDRTSRPLAGPGARRGRRDQVERFPRLVTRLGAPATGPTDYPAPASRSTARPRSAQFVTQLLGDAGCGSSWRPTWRSAARPAECGRGASAGRRCDRSCGRRSATRRAWLLEPGLDLRPRRRARLAGARIGPTTRAAGGRTTLEGASSRCERYLALLERLVSASPGDAATGERPDTADRARCSRGMLDAARLAPAREGRRPAEPRAVRSRPGPTPVRLRGPCSGSAIWSSSWNRSRSTSCEPGWRPTSELLAEAGAPRDRRSS